MEDMKEEKGIKGGEEWKKSIGKVMDIGEGLMIKVDDNIRKCICIYKEKIGRKEIMEWGRVGISK